MYDADQIDERVFVGGYYGDNEAMLRFIEAHGIGSVISLINSDVGPIRQALGLPMGDHIHVYCEDAPTCVALSNAMPALFEYIMRRIGEGKRVLVHCHAGVSRSAALAVYYIMRSQQLSYEEALNLVNAKRRVAINDHFVSFLASRCIYRFVDNKLKLQIV
ncbi:protein tyrosine phosphatase 2 [Samia ricini nucleopolyhedrovirus]|nr:ptp 2 [Philosamia cynthia ricini nucleopolyhedrovirus virus]BBD51208.1 protein tyrosine phosphatase 2 [Samia ricini nucleopolyhedrovirus]BBD51360.1 protein tyrosine phosphatase 2 [Samia ricini nucleopolyhedrovirus]BBD51512.1 protein tyrosine phosphatase 2 [Samia ricini nucleopolyhedrovirus]